MHKWFPIANSCAQEDPDIVFWDHLRSSHETCCLTQISIFWVVLLILAASHWYWNLYTTTHVIYIYIYIYIYNIWKIIIHLRLFFLHWNRATTELNKDCLIFDDMSTHLGLFYAKRLGNHVHCIFIITFSVYFFLKNFCLFLSCGPIEYK